MLNNKQNQAVIAPADAATLVLAGAGSGKTTVMAHRIVKLFNVDGIPAHKIMGVTFTRKSANELAERVSSLEPRLHAGTAGRFTSGALISTFHGACLNILYRLSARPGLVLPRNLARWTIIDVADQKKVIKDLIALYPAEEGLFDSKADQVKAIAGFIENCKQNMKRHRDVDDRFLGVNKKYCNMIYSHYEQRCLKESLYDFNEIVLVVVELLRDIPEVRELVASWFDYVLVDEYQDTNDMQEAFIRYVLNGRKCVTVVGDDDQSIYGWRGANAALILGFAKRYGPNTVVITLEENYRSTKNILDAANSIIKNNTERHNKVLFTSGQQGRDIEFNEYHNNFREAEGVMEQVIEDIKNGIHPNEIAVLFRGNAQTVGIESTFSKAGIAYRMTGGQNFWDRKEVKVAMCYARLAINPSDSPAFAVACAAPKRGIGEASLKKLEAKVRETGKSFAEVLGEQRGAKAKEMARVLLKLEEMKDRTDLVTFFETLLRDSGVLEYFRESDSMTLETRADNLYALLDIANQASDNTTLSEFCEQAALTAEGAKKGSETEAVALSTIHGAKGLEWKKVYLIGMVQGLFPHGRALAEGQIEEERRLAYVAFTRAKEELVVSYPSFDRNNDFSPVSCFVKESGIM